MKRHGLNQRCAFVMPLAAVVRLSRQWVVQFTTSNAAGDFTVLAGPKEKPCATIGLIEEALRLLAETMPALYSHFRADSPQLMLLDGKRPAYWADLRISILDPTAIQDRAPMVIGAYLISSAVAARFHRRLGRPVRSGSQLQRATLRSQVAYARRLVMRGYVETGTTMGEHYAKLLSSLTEKA